MATAYSYLSGFLLFFTTLVYRPSESSFRHFINPYGRDVYNTPYLPGHLTCVPSATYTLIAAFYPCSSVPSCNYTLQLCGFFYNLFVLTPPNKHSIIRIASEQKTYTEAKHKQNFQNSTS